MPNENEVTLSLALDDQVSPALANVEAGYLAALAALEAATLASSAAWLAPLSTLSAATQEALGWLSALGAELAALAQAQATPTVAVNDLATPTLRAIRAELAALSGELVVVTQQAAAQTVSYSMAPASATIDRTTVRQVIIPELNRLGYRA